MKRLSLLLFAALSACSSAPTQPPADPSQFGGRTQEQLRQSFGSPQRVAQLDRLVVYEYRNLRAPGSATPVYSFLIENERVIESTPGTLQLYREDGITKVKAESL
ncbi:MULTISPECIES: hypothetical protein [Pseudomonas]|jgi:hypothetical protein|uniref:Lipoprotein SmpA/OmlA domain-containing protein n=1 Tax=Pseudomonas flavocrustae TaxID=2991719 RepID=A0ABT6ICJ2_9PSED|nr:MULTISPECIES: hypothetical protein [Pseudomonas]MDH4762257.1 hypothetical protein [Pseudomonas sp. CBMAI 2609]MDK8265122.1 hypothetical protein [Pseudomonas oryzihabitans]QNQ98781.1 hypothetical protein BGI51_14435 [Pseudomonas psychrotolerans]